MKQLTLTFFGIILLNNFHGVFSSSLNPEVAEIYSNVSDCGDGEIFNFNASLTPKPLIWVQPQSVWLGGRFSIKEQGQSLVANMSERDFSKLLTTTFFIDEPVLSEMTVWIQQLIRSLIPKTNNSESCGSFLPSEACPVIHQLMLSAPHINLPLFGETAGIDIFGPAGTNFLDAVLTLLAGLRREITIRIKLSLYETPIACLRLGIFIGSYGTNYSNLNQLKRINFENSFLTPKYVVNFQNKTLSCPINSIEMNDSSCHCKYPFSGPFCAFQCNYQNITVDGCYSDLVSIHGPLCQFNSLDYTSDCLTAKNISVLDGNVTVEVLSLNHIKLNWKLVNFFTWYDFEISLYDKNTCTGIVGIISNSAFNFGSTSTFNITAICMNQKLYGAVCGNTTNDEETCLNCPSLQLTPFSNYTIAIRFSALGTKGQNSLAVYGTLAANTSFTSPEADPIAPEITSVVFSTDRSFILIEWIINERCPGFIRHSEIHVLCSADHAMLSGDLHFDCRNGNHGPRLNATIPIRCRGVDLQITLCIATNQKMSEESKPFPLKDNTWPPLLTFLAVGSGAFIIAVVIGALIFVYYYKRHVQTYQNVYRTLSNLLHVRRHAEIGQSFRKPNAPSISVPDVPSSQIYCDPNSETVFQTVASTPDAQTPRSLQSSAIDTESVTSASTSSSTPRDSLGYKLWSFE